MGESGPSSSSGAERMKRFRELTLKRNEARKLNHQEVVEEDRRAKLPANYESKVRRADWEVADYTNKKLAEEKGEDYDRTKMLDIPADVVDQIERSKARKRNPDPGFSDFEAATKRTYDRLTKQMKPNMEKYNDVKEKMGEAFYPTADTLIIGTHKDSKEAIDRMVDDLDKQQEKRTKYHRHRPYDPNVQIDFINNRNAKFNKKLERFYGEYTQDIKQNIERGTAI